MAVLTEIQWRGTDDEQRTARTIFELMYARGRFFADGAPIKLNVAELQRFLYSQEALRATDDESAQNSLVESSIAANPHIFALATDTEEPVVVTTKAGIPPAGDGDAYEDTSHSFRSRLFTGAHEPTEEELEAVKGVRKDLTDEYLVGLPETSALPPIQEEPEFATVEAEEEIPFVPEPEELEPVQPQQPAVPTEVRIGDVIIDLAGDPDKIKLEYADLFKQKLSAYLEDDFRFVQFGNEYYLEDRVERLSKGQLRDIKDYIDERNEPLSDEEIISDALRRPLQDADYSLWRFTINYRLSRERKDFRFVGTADDRLWATSMLAAIGDTYRKPNEIAQDYRYLLDPELSDSPEIESNSEGKFQMSHILTWYESENGVLPVGPEMMKLMPQPLLEDQTHIVLRIQDPQNFATYLAELRLGVNNRGTYIAGLDELFQGTMVPGAQFTLAQGAGSNEFTIEYESQPAQEARLLQYDSRKDRWFFAPLVYECPVNESYLLTEERFGELNNQKRATDSERKKPDVLLERAFNIIGEQADDGALTALLDDLMPAVNLERPFSKSYLLSLVKSPQYPAFTLEDESLGLVSLRK